MLRPAAVLVAGCLAWSAFAADVAPHTPSPTAPLPIASVVAKAGTGDAVVIRGRVAEKLGASTYALVDDTARVNARIPDTLLTGGIVLPPGTRVEVRGHVAFTPGRSVEIEAKRVTVLRGHETPLGGDGVQIR